MKRLTAALAASLSIAAFTANAAEVYRLTTAEGSRIILIDGNLDQETPQKVRYALDKFNGMAGFVLNSPGGSTRVAMELQQLVISTGASSKTTVPAYGICASACVDVLFVASTIQAHSSSRIGVHQAIRAGQARVDLYATDIYRLRGVPESVVTKMNVTPPSKVAWLNSREFLAIPGARFMQAAVTAEQIVAEAQYHVVLR